ncbi:alpha/beta fold hydrolase [Fulvivirgaceae bacterium BMA12]|uniref:Alpha/beta fold hydrolase n=1 Tax=Agaribacillus aureus TaxID=3051825 RepID=A0ABT8LK74_9BACT|nr:alpha/beta fold hydrolase [Fulvivirgaceae bacterium BMA12]
MPVVDPTSYHQPPRLLINGHFETIYPALLRTVNGVNYQRERIFTADDDFLDLDWSKVNGKQLVIISHGLEGDTGRAYMKGMVRAFNNQGFDALAWNYRGCSGEINKQRRFYHSGATDDLDVVINHVINQYTYDKLYLIGFSLGGNLTLKYLGEKNLTLSQKIEKSVVFSVPLNLHTSCLKISEPANFLYARRFLKSLVGKIKSKARVRSDLSTTGIGKIRTLMEFDDRYTAPMHGFGDAKDYYSKCSAINFVDAIRIPTLIVNAKNDPFLPAECYPAEKLKSHPHVYFEMPDKGGHVGFAVFGEPYYWSERRAVEFIMEKNIN